MKPIVSILIPAYNAEPWIADTIKTALAQTWPRTEIIVVDDGSRDQTLSIARQFASKNISVVTQENQGAAAARNCALALSQGEFIQWLDADDLLSPDKVAKQMAAMQKCQDKRQLFSSGWGYFYYRLDRANFTPTSLWCDLSPVEWLIRKMGQNLHMPPATWLVSRELTQAAGPWDTRLSLDDDGEYFCRAVVRSDGIRFVPEAKIFYRVSGSGSLSDFDESEKKLASLFLSMQLHVGYLCSLENSARVRSACLSYLQRRFFRFYPEQMAFVQQLQQLAATLGGELEAPQLSWKYAWLRELLGWKLTKRFRFLYNRSKSVGMRAWDKALSSLEAKDELGTTSHFRANPAASDSQDLVLPRTSR